MDLSPAMFVLLRAAVHNPANAFFILLSESCVPLYPPRVFYLQIISSRRSRVNGTQLLCCRAPLADSPPRYLLKLDERCTGGCEDAPQFGHHDVPQRRSRKVLWCGPPPISKLTLQHRKTFKQQNCTAHASKLLRADRHAMRPACAP